MAGLTWLDAARAQWRWRGQERPPFAIPPRAGQSSVWDYPRPPRIVADTREVVVCWGELEAARTRRALRVLETAHPLSLHLPRDDVVRELLQPSGGGSSCEWKRPARYWALEAAGRRLPGVEWSYLQPLPDAESLSDCVAFYPAPLDCRVDGALVWPQPGGFYGGWIAPVLAWPFKDDRGSEGW